MSITYPGHVKGTFAAQPRGLVLHGSRSGKPYTLAQEFSATAGWATNDDNPYGWNVTVGDGVYAAHMTARQWGRNAGDESATHLAVEFAQPTVAHAITDGQVAALLLWWRREVLPVWPALDMHAGGFALVGHSETPQGRADGKSDAFPAGDWRLADLKQRIRAGLLPPPDPDDAALERRYQAGRVRYGEKIRKARLDRHGYRGPVLITQRGIVALDDIIEARLREDMETLLKGSGGLTEWP